MADMFCSTTIPKTKEVVSYDIDCLFLSISATGVSLTRIPRLSNTFRYFAQMGDSSPTLAAIALEREAPPATAVMTEL